jgi:hypothetical protein
MNSLFAQATNASAWTALEHAALLASVAGAIIMWLTYRKKRENIRVYPQPLQVEGEMKVSPKHVFNPEKCDARHDTLEERMSGVDAQIGELWRTMRAEDADTRAQLYKAVRDFDRTIGDLHGTLHQIDVTMHQVLDKMLQQ